MCCTLTDHLGQSRPVLTRLLMLWAHEPVHEINPPRVESGGPAVLERRSSNHIKT